MAASGFTLSHRDASGRKFWIAQGQASRRIAEHFSRKLGGATVNNHWIPDGTKDAPADRFGPRARLVESLDAIVADKAVDRRRCVDAVEGKLFGLGSEDYVVGSHEFYYSYAQSRGLAPRLDLGHYHPAESVADKVSALLQFHPRLLRHTRRPVRWDSDHVVILNDEVRALFQEIARGDAGPGVRGAGLLRCQHQPPRRLCDRHARDPAGHPAWVARPDRAAETAGRGHERLALNEHAKAMPWGAVWDELCDRAGVPAGADWLKAVASHEKAVLAKRR